MRLLIDTTQREKLFFELIKDNKAIARQEKQVIGLSESFLPELSNFLKRHKSKLQDIEKILVNPGPGGFSSTRTGVAIANALAYALRIPVAKWPSGRVKKSVMPIYDKLPNITKPKRV